MFEGFYEKGVIYEVGEHIWFCGYLSIKTIGMLIHLSDKKVDLKSNGKFNTDNS